MNPLEADFELRMKRANYIFEKKERSLDRKIQDGYAETSFREAKS